MEPLFLAFALSMAACLAAVPLLRRLAITTALVDRPDGRRKIHGRPIPVVGGLAVFAAFWLVLGLALTVPHTLRDAMREQIGVLVGLLVASCVIVALGVADDLGRVRVRHKLLGQCIAILPLVWAGVNVQFVYLFGWRLDLGFCAVPFTMFFLLGAINSINLIDGMDGLLGSVGLWLSLALAGMASLAGHDWAALVAVTLAGALIAFLRYNFPPATIFMGDAGSMLVGLLLGTLSIQCSLKAPATIVMLLPVGLLTLPFLDTAAAILRRKLTGRSICDTDRGHLHHCMLRRGISVRMVLVIVSACCLVTSAGVLASQAFGSEWIVVLTTVTVISTLIIFRLFGFVETVLLCERLAALWASPKAPRRLEVRLQGSHDWKELWDMLTEQAEQLGLQQLLLDVNAPSLHEAYHARWDRVQTTAAEGPTLWRFEVPLLARGHAAGRLQIAAAPDAVPAWSKIATLTDVVETYVNRPAEMTTLVPAILTQARETPESVQATA
jgi:UDP-GlcNAc:undecaprenyl-phosphate GlcNAc-1-phosphate transferase